jgi:hypothetical protein
LLSDNIIARLAAFIYKSLEQGRRLINLRDDNFKYRLVTLVTAALLGAFALVLGLSLLGAVFGLKAFNPIFGSFLSHSYGITAFFIPVYLGYAAFILADPSWRPDRIFILGAALFPFLTLGVGYIFIRDFEALARDYALLEFLGKTGLGILIVILIFLEVVVLQIIKNAMFPLGRLARKGPFLLPPPKDEPKAAAGKVKPGAKIVEFPPPSEDGEGLVIELPAVRPLSSPLALAYMEEASLQPVNRPNEKPEEKPVEQAEKKDAAKDRAGSVERAIEEA